MRLVVGALVCYAGVLGVRGQEAPVVLTAERVRSAMESSLAKEGLSDEGRTIIKNSYGEAFAMLANAEADRVQAAAWAAVIDTSAGVVKKLQEEAGLIVVPEDATTLISEAERDLSSVDLRALVSQEEGKLAQLGRGRDSLVTKIAAESERPLRIPSEVKSLEVQLTELADGLAVFEDLDPSAAPVREAERVLLEARKLSLEAELEKLEQERLSSVGRLQVLKARQGLVGREYAASSARVGVLQKFARDQVEEVAKKVAQAADAARQSGDGEASLAALVQNYSIALQRASELLTTIQADLDKIQIAQTKLNREFELVRNQIEVGGDQGASAHVLMEKKRELPDPRDIKRALSQNDAEMVKVKLDRLQVDRALSDLPETAEGEGSRLEEARRTVLEELDVQYGQMIFKYGELELAENNYIATIEEFDQLLREKLFWVRSSPPISLETVRGLGGGFRWLAGADRGDELASAFTSTLHRHSIQLGSLALLAVGLLLARPRFRRRMKANLVPIRSVNSDSYRYTLEGFGFVLLISVPFPLLLLVLGRYLRDADASVWVLSLADGVVGIAPVLFGFVFVRELCRPGGLMEAHFRWNKALLASLRRGVSRIGWLYVPAGVIIVMLFSEREGLYIDSLGRVVFMVTMLWVAYWVSVIMHPQEGAFAGSLQRQPDSNLTRTKLLWYPLLILIPVSLAVLAGFGYLVTALMLDVYYQRSVTIVVGGVLLYCLLLRWFSIRERKLALERVLAKRKARQEALAQPDAPQETREEAGLLDHEEEVDLAHVGVQTRRLLRALVVSVGVGILWLVWESALPALRSLDMEPVLGGATIADFLMATLVVVATIVVARNLPGILEIAILQNLPIDSGSRYAYASLAQYSIVAVGAMLTFHLLPFDWSQLAWAVAALSVGLGFGLQEIVANFVCGIILLFERPIRVGDVVTVGEVTGTVSRIRMRATTIIDWDRKEFVVPNKAFITGQLLNWTLSNTTNRIMINVGVAYGSDIVRVQEVLREILDNHGDLMSDPSPLVTFGNFGDSSLDFAIRCYLPNLDRRLAVTHELYCEIYRRFAEEEIEIPFPQRDLHMKTGNVS
jgi:potassium efflux system protein